MVMLSYVADIDILECLIVVMATAFDLAHLRIV